MGKGKLPYGPSKVGGKKLKKVKKTTKTGLSAGTKKAAPQPRELRAPPPPPPPPAPAPAPQSRYFIQGDEEFQANAADFFAFLAERAE